MTGNSSADHAPAMSPRPTPFEAGAWSIPHPQPFVCDVCVTAAQLSRTIEHVSNIEYVRWLDRAAELHADHLGYTRAELRKGGIMWFVARHEIDYLAEAFLGDELVVATWVRNVKKVKSWRDYVIVRPADGTIICRAATLWVLIDLETRKPLRMTSEMIERFQPLES